MAEVAADSGELKTGKNSLSSTKKEMKLSELKVTDLKNELESRGLDKTGVKAALVDRLRKAIESEGENPDDYVFESSADSQVSKKIVKKESKDLNNDSKHESENEEEEETEDDKQESRDSEVLQVSVDDKEDTIDNKEVVENEQMDTTEAQDATLKLDVSENSINSKENDSSEQIILDSTETVDNDEKSAEASTPTKAKVAGKAPVRILANKAKAIPVAKSIWITNLPLSTRAADLKSFFSKHGKVMLVKIVTNAKQTTGEKKFYGYITLTTSKEATKAVQDLNNTELNGQPVKLELTTDQPNTLLKKAAKVVVRKVKAVGVAAKVSAVKAKEKVAESKETKGEENPEKEAKDDKSSVARRDREREHRSRERRDYRDFYPRGSFRRPFGFRGRGRGRGAFPFREGPPIESFRRPFGRRPFFGGRMGYRPALKPSFMQFKMREERQRERMRERSIIRESERRRAEDAFRQKLVERKQREEAYRLDREKVQLRIEREMLEREKAEYLKNEREKQRMERERIEREREKLRRQAQMREMSNKRPFPPSPVDREPSWEKEKRPRHYESRYPSFAEKLPGSEGRPEFREAPPSYRKFEHRPDHYEREAHSASTSRSEFTKYGKERPDPTMRDHDERRVYKRPYFKEEAMRSYPPREVERYAPPPEDRGYKRKMHETMRSPRPRGGGGGRRMPYY